MLIIFNDTITDMISYKNLNRNISLVFVTQSYLKVFKDVRENSTLLCKFQTDNCFNKLLFIHSLDIGFKDFKCTYCTKPYSFLVNDTTDNQIFITLPFRKNLLERI